MFTAFHKYSCVSFLAAALSCVLPTLLFADDWPQWGGPKRDIVWREEGIVEKFSTDGLLPRVWSVPVAEGYSGPAVADGRVFLTDRLIDGEFERLMCFDAETGKPLWKHQYFTRYTVSYPAGPRATPVVDGDRVYFIGTQGDMFCMTVDEGKILWQKNFPQDFGTELPIWGMAASPLVDGDKLITLVGGKNDGLVVCFDTLTGKEIWRALNGADAGYCPPVIYEFGGRRQLIIWHPAAIASLDPETGKVLWEIP